MSVRIGIWTRTCKLNFRFMPSNWPHKCSRRAVLSSPRSSDRRTTTLSSTFWTRCSPRSSRRSLHPHVVSPPKSSWFVLATKHPTTLTLNSWTPSMLSKTLIKRRVVSTVMSQTLSTKWAPSKCCSRLSDPIEWATTLSHSWLMKFVTLVISSSPPIPLNSWPSSRV